MDNDGKVLEFKKKIKTEADYIASLDEKLEERIQGFLRFENSLTEDELAYILETKPTGHEYAIQGCDFSKMQKFNQLAENFIRLSQCDDLNVYDIKISKPNRTSLHGIVSAHITNPFKLNNEDEGLAIWNDIIQNTDYFVCMDDDCNETTISAGVHNIYNGKITKDFYGVEWLKDEL